ncbi:2-C-methyl-D-erythritol 4-phosphate cytidylyltransferase [Fictibacillus aquaticus]|uniref:2-C-methyl-D-erythritol 4-phosphate cytidylyltransferase n=1 Tax=Fictibacillus aquaticus TaxID=2021314 RepID=A0A235F6Y5_9BACL|nr:2-C-methyl-D-erythritol 4-phosphate cytidylyltransferase [Fictibacillus aquaticus]OYD57096.1 2-C-methyl-D-erythritol 4-phosphate cytidylyltransferase [Fictibacillus aquaticus]
MEYKAIVLAAGQGKRMNAGKNKQWIELEGMPVIAHTIKVFENDPWCSGIILVGNEREMRLLEEFRQFYGYKKIENIVPGGKERQDSVYEGLKALDDDGLVLIHDGARPFVAEKDIHSLAEKADETGAAVLAVPVKDTIKHIKEGQVTHTMDRSSLWAAQTPQAFRLSVIKKFHTRAAADGWLGTDDASLAEKYGEAVAVVEGDYRNIKLTTADDLLFAKAILRERQEEQ